jgi:signal transduction histidine kinase
VRERRIVLLVALLAFSFVLTAVLAYHAQDAARSHRRTAERTLRDYASLAALQFGIHVKEDIYWRINALLSRPGGMAEVATGGERTSAIAAQLAHPNCPLMASAADAADAAAFLFRVELHDHTMPASRGCVTPAVRRWIRDTVAVHATTYFKKTWEFGDFIGAVDGEPWLVGYIVSFDRWGKPATAFGFASPFREFAAPTFRDVVKHAPLLPPTLVGDTPNDSLLSVVVTDTAGHELFRSTPQYASAYTGDYDLTKFGGMAIRLALRPEVADRLVIGGLPRSRVPLLVGLLALAGTMLVVAVLQLRREYELARLRADFISNISHELRTPLAQVRMFAETLLLGRVRSEAEQRRSLEIIDQEARRLTHLVENVLQFSRSERRVSRLAPEPTDLAGQVDEVVEAFAPLARARRVTVKTELAEGAVAVVDRAAFRQTLLNLLDNAVKYGPAGQAVTIGVAPADAHVVRVWVDDEGPGITPRERDRIWQPFYRLERDAQSAVAGSGIGLAVVHDLVTQHGGRVSVEAAPSGGARFVVELPRSDRAPTSGAPAAPSAAPSAAPGPAAPTPAAPPTPSAPPSSAPTPV